MHAAFNFQIEYGTRFFGYQEETGNCSYASIDISSQTATMSSLTFTFKTSGESGVLLYSKSDVSILWALFVYFEAVSQTGIVETVLSIWLYLLTLYEPYAKRLRITVFFKYWLVLMEYQ